MLWTTLLLTRHTFRLWQSRILLLAFTALVVLWNLPGLSRAAAGHLPGFSAAGSAYLGWPRWLGYAWLLIEARRADSHGRQLFELHPLELGRRASLFSCYSYRCILEVLLLWACAELLLRLSEFVAGHGFHVEPVAVIANCLLVSSLFLVSHSIRILLSAARIAVPLLIGLFLLAETLAQTASRAPELLELATGLLLLALATAFLTLIHENDRC